MMYLIMGRTASGKDTLRRMLEERYGWKFVVSYATRPPRSQEETDCKSHIFISPEEAAAITEKLAVTVINGYEYFATAEQVRNCDAYIIDPKGYGELAANLPEEDFRVVYLKPAGAEEQKSAAVRRADNPEAETAVFETRAETENAQFAAFEEWAERTERDNVRVITNDYRPQTLDRLARDLAVEKLHAERARLITKALKARNGAYAPYSGFNVGAALLCADGTVYTGCNVENVVYGETMCAERVALFKAVSEGRRDFTVIAVAGSGSGYTVPCGSCLQALSEFCGPDLAVIMCDREGNSRETSLGRLMPETFRML